MNSIQLTVVIDNNSSIENAPGEHGLSLHLASQGQTLLFDAGRSHQIVANLETLGLSEPAPSWIALSHGHYDHTNGVPVLLQRYPQAKLHYHPRLLEPKWILDADQQWRYGGAPLAFYQLAPHYLQPLHSMELIPGVHASGSIVGENAQSFVRGRFFRNPGGHLRVDTFPEEQILIVRSARGVSIISGCAHTGLQAALEKKRSLFPREPLYALIGGLHLEGKTDAEYSAICQLIADAGIQKVMPLHCTGNGFLEYLKANMPQVFVAGSVGVSIEL